MRLSSLQYAFRDALRSLWRNKFMGLASIATVAISLLIFGCAWLLVLNTQYLADTMEAELEINLYLKPELTREQGLNLKNQIAAISGLDEIKFVPKEEGLKSLEERFGKDTNIMQAMGGNNPLPDVYRLKSKDATQVPRIAGEVAKIPGVDTVRYGQGMVERLLSLTNWLRTIGMIIIAAIGLAGIFLIATTIRITVFARRREVGIMKLVGATNWYIRWPFFLEGMMIGVLGALISVGVLHFFYTELIKNVATTVNFLPIISERSVLWNLYEILLLTGAILGALGSAISLRRFLKV